MKKVSIILVNYNGKAFNHACIDSILKQTYSNFEIIFIDNNSTDWSLEDVEKSYAKEIDNDLITIIPNKTNEWFSGANNQGHKAAHGDYIWLLNNDTIVTVDVLEKMVQALEASDNLWWVSCTILDAWYEKQIQDMHASWKVIISNYFWDSVLAWVPNEERTSWLFHTSVLSGCSFLYRKNIIWYPFPEYYFAYWEDVRLSWYLLTQWYSLWIVTDASINHLGSASFGKKPTIFKVFHGTKNQWMNFLTFFTWPVTLLLLPMYLLVQLAQTFLSSPIIRIKWKWKALVWLVKNIWIIKAQRNFVQNWYKITHKQLLRQLHYLFIDNIYFANFTPGQMRVVRALNVCFFGVIKLFHIPYRG